MKQSATTIAFLVALSFGWANPVAATFHIIVVEQVYPGAPEAPAAQYVMLRLQAPVQIAVYGQPLPVYDAAGDALASFAAFCNTPHAACSLATVSPACKDGGCPAAFDANGSRILVATRWAQGLFCVTPDLLAAGSVPYPSGRVCFGDCSVRTDCGDGPVDCVAYGSFSGDNGVFGAPAAAPPLGMALVASPDRTNQFIGGMLLASDVGFSVGLPTPINYHADVGSIDGVEGDANGDAAVNADDVAAATDALFAGGARCDLAVPRRGADANFDTRVSAADVTAAIKLATSAS